MDRDKQSEFDDAYNAYSADWGQLHDQMKKDLHMHLGDQWDGKERAYLAKQRREALVFNKVRRIIKSISGYQRKNRHSLRLDPVLGTSQEAVEYLSGLLLWNTQLRNGYNIISDAFEHGALITGLNMIELAVDYSDDMVNGDVVWLRHDYNSVLFDLNCRQRDLRDCEAILNRTLVSESRLQQLIPSIKIEDLGPPNQTLSKFPAMTQSHRMRNNASPYPYDRMWVKTAKQITVLIDKSNGQAVHWSGDEDRLREWFEMAGVTEDQIAVVKRAKESVELRVFANCNHVWSGPDPTGLNEYPWVPFIGFWNPESELPELRIQGIIRCDRDPQDEVNKRRSKMLDIIDSQISSGWVAKEGAVRNKEQLYQTGQGKVIWISDDVALPLEHVIRENRPADIPQGLFTLTQIMDNDVLEIPGFNKEMLGMPDASDVEVSAVLAKLRQSSGLTVLADLFDNLEYSQKILGTKTARAIKKNYTAQKMMKVMGKQPPQSLMSDDFMKFECVCVEGLLTDTQRQHYYAQLMAMKKMGAEVIPWSAIIDAWPLEGKSELVKKIQEAEQARAKADEENQKLNQLQIQLNQSYMQANLARATERLEKAKDNQTSATYDRIRTLKELQNLDLNNLEQFVTILHQLKGTPPNLQNDIQIMQPGQGMGGM